MVTTHFSNKNPCGESYNEQYGMVFPLILVFGIPSIIKYLPAYRFSLFIFVHSINAFKTSECRIINYLRLKCSRWEVIINF